MQLLGLKQRMPGKAEKSVDSLPLEGILGNPSPPARLIELYLTSMTMFNVLIKKTALFLYVIEETLRLYTFGIGLK